MRNDHFRGSVIQAGSPLPWLLFSAPGAPTWTLLEPLDAKPIASPERAPGFGVKRLRSPAVAVALVAIGEFKIESTRVLDVRQSGDLQGSALRSVSSVVVLLRIHI